MSVHVAYIFAETLWIAFGGAGGESSATPV